MIQTRDRTRQCAVCGRLAWILISACTGELQVNGKGGVRWTVWFGEV